MKKALALAAALFSVATMAQETAPIRALLVTGGCCHDYYHQSRSLTSAVRARANVDWTVVHEGNNSTNHKARIYDVDGWESMFDIVVHNECFAKVTDEAWIKRITAAHATGTPAVVIHCAMHTYRDIKDDEWRKFLGVTSKRHEHKSNKKVKNVKPDHPIMKGFGAEWTSPIDELYIVEKVWPTATVLAYGVSDGKNSAGEEHAGFWINQYKKAKVFGTTFGHSNETFDDPIFQDTVTRGLLWACDKLDDDGTPKEGYEGIKAKRKKPKKK
jgi:type 1 glutamine amidotransferase